MSTDEIVDELKPSRRQFRVVKRLKFTVAWLAGVALLVWYFYPRDTIKPCQTNMRQISKALHSYYDDYKVFPPAFTLDKQGNRMHSWRVLLLPYLGEEELFARYNLNEPWDGPNNRKLSTKIPSVYCCPGDRWRETTDTSYVAVVGTTTTWPGARPKTYGSFIMRGTSSSIALVETKQSGIHWMQPDDIPWSPYVKRDVLDRVLHSHEGGSNVAFFDGTARFVKSTVDEHAFARALNLTNFSYIKDPGDSIGSFRKLALAASFAKTDVLPFTTGKIKPGRNYVYCATAQLAWDKWRDQRGVDSIHLAGCDEFCRHLNADRFPIKDLSPNHYVAIAGDNIWPQARQELRRKFSRASVNIPSNHQNGMALFAYLAKNLPFKEKFGVQEEPVRFSSSAGKFEVASFGIEEASDDDVDLFQDQVKVLDYRSHDDFVIQLNTETDVMILAKVERLDTLQETIEAVRARETAPYPLRSLKLDDKLMVPMLAISVDRSYPELEGDLVACRQIIRFLLNESGARIESTFQGTLLAEGMEFDPKRPRVMVFDRPFLTYIKERQASQPYFAMWVENLEVMSAFIQE